MSAPYISTIKRSLPHADIVHEKFHISQHLNDAVDKTRRQEHRILMKNNDDILKGTKFLWLRGLDRLSDESLAGLESIKRRGLNVSKAWYIRELFVHFWTRRDATFAQSYFDYWYKEAFGTGLREVRKVARMIKKAPSEYSNLF